MRRLPFGRSEIRRLIAQTEASNVSPDLLSIDHRIVPRPVVAHWAFYRKFAGVPVYHNKNKFASH